jgi:HK97 family phage major capsid protein
MSGVMIKAAADGAALELALIGEVGWEINASVLQRALVGRTEDLTINLFSYGGDAIEGLAIYSMLARYPGKKRMVIDGVAASAASVIAMAGDEIVMPESSFLMIHEAWGLAIGGSGDLRQQADLIDRISTAYRQAYSARSGMSDEDVASLMAAESWLTAAEAVEFGFATEAAPAREIRSAAVPRGRFAKVPQALASLVEFVEPSRPKAQAATVPVEAASDQQSKDPPAAANESETDEQVQEVHSLSSGTQPAPVPMTITNNEAADREAAAIQAERDRARTIRNMCEQSGAGIEKAEEYINSGTDVGKVREELFALVTGKEKRSITSRLQDSGDGLLGMSDQEIKSYNILNAIRHFSDPTDVRLREAAGLELEASAAAVRQSGRELQGSFRIPADVMIAQIPGMGAGRKGIRADQTAGGFTTGGALIDTDLLVGSMIELIYNRLSITAAGATVLSGLVGDIDIPKETAGPTHYWVGEGQAPDASEILVGQLSLTPKTVGAKTVLTRRFIGQTSFSAEAWVRSHLSRKVALGIDKDFLYSTGGSKRPLGLRYTDGVKTETLSGGQTKTINSVSYNFGTFLNLVEMETKVSLANLDVPSMVYMMNAHARGVYKTTLENAQSDFYILRNNEINGYPALMSNQLEVNNSLFGDMSQILLAFWSGQDIGVNPYKYQDSGSVEISILQDCDFGVRYPEAFVFGI